MTERYQWVTSPGNYGGSWCSPAPLYRQLAAKTNASARVIDMTSFEFVTAPAATAIPAVAPWSSTGTANAMTPGCVTRPAV
jgi:hypothetical protein